MTGGGDGRCWEGGDGREVTGGDGRGFWCQSLKPNKSHKRLVQHPIINTIESQRLFF